MLKCESLEARDVPAAISAWFNVIFVEQASDVHITPGERPNDYTIVADGQRFDWRAADNWGMRPAQVFVFGTAGDDVLVNDSDLSVGMYGQRGHDYYRTGTGRNTVVTGPDGSVVDATRGTNVINLHVGWPAVSGGDRVYVSALNPNPRRVPPPEYTPYPGYTADPIEVEGTTAVSFAGPQDQIFVGALPPEAPRRP